MSRLSDYAHDAPWYARKATVPLQNGLYRATRPLRTVSGQVGNWRRRRFAETGKGFWAERATRGLRSSLPGYRDRINPATGRPRRDDAEIYRRRDEQFARMRKSGAFTPGTGAWEHGPDAYRALPAQPRESAQERNERLTRQHNEHCPLAQRQPVDARERADKVLGPGRADRAAEALRQSRVNPWEDREPVQRGRTR